MPTILAYVGDGLSILALSIIYSLSLAVHRAQPDANRLKLWALPAVALLISLPLGYVARTWPATGVEAGLVLGARALTSALLAILHLSVAQRR